MLRIKIRRLFGTGEITLDRDVIHVRAQIYPAQHARESGERLVFEGVRGARAVRAVIIGAEAVFRRAVVAEPRIRRGRRDLPFAPEKRFVRERLRNIRAERKGHRIVEAFQKRVLFFLVFPFAELS